MDSTVGLGVVGAGMNAMGMQRLFTKSLLGLLAASNTTSRQVSLSMEQPVWTGPPSNGPPTHTERGPRWLGVPPRQATSGVEGHRTLDSDSTFPL